MTTHTFDVLGIPAPQGSKRHVGRGVLVESSKAVKPWREAIVWQAREAGLAGKRLDGDIVVLLLFRLPRPRGHYGTGRNAGALRKSAPKRPNVKPDLDKLVRAVGDALSSAAVIADDARIVGMTATKVYADAELPPGVSVGLEVLS